MSYIGTEPKDIRSFGRTKFDYTATQGQTAFTGADDDGKVLAFTVGQIEVYVNGILMDDSDFTTTGTGTVTLASAANLNDVVNVVSFETNIPDSNYVPATGGTFSGDVDFGANKITYANIYAQLSDLPSASTYHGMFAHVHATGLAYYAHAGAWIPLAKTTGATFSDSVVVDAAGATPLTVDRATSDGTIIDVQKDGSSVGTIGTNGSRLSIGSGDVNLNFNASANSMYPISDTSGSLSDNIVDIGAATARFKDLYLGGGAYLGGTGAANKLSDYEEGTWTPTSGVTHTYHHASYTKIGQLVYINIDVQCGSSSSTSAIVFSTPFQASFNYNTGSFNYQTTSLNDATINLGPNGIYFRTAQSGGDMNYNQASNARLIFNAIYHTNA